MTKSKKALMSSAPWRVEEENQDDFKDAKLKITNQPGSSPTMHVPRKKSSRSKVEDPNADSLAEIDPELRYSFQRNFQGVVDPNLRPATPNLFVAWLLLLNVCACVDILTPNYGCFLQLVFSIDTVVKPLPPAMGYHVSRNLNFFTRIFTQFFDPEGIANAQKSLGIGQEERVRRVR